MPSLGRDASGGLSVEVTFESRPKRREEPSQATLWGKDVLNSGSIQCTCPEIN